MDLMIYSLDDGFKFFVNHKSHGACYKYRDAVVLTESRDHACALYMANPSPRYVDDDGNTLDHGKRWKYTGVTNSTFNVPHL